MIKCPNCGAELKYDIKDEVVKCLYCESDFNPEELNENVTIAKKLADKISAKTYLCQSCGAKLLTFDDTAATFCDYCGSENMLEDKLIKLNKPDFVIPFKITKEECVKIYNDKINKSLFVPTYMKNNMVLEKARGIYMPYCIYNFFYDGNVSYKGKKHWKYQGNYEYFKDYLLEFYVKSNVDGLSYELVSRFLDRYSKAISPFYLKDGENFNINYMSGFYVDNYDVKKGTYLEDAEEVLEKFSWNELRKNSIFNKYGCYRPKVNYELQDSKIGMFPVYFLAFRDEKNGKISYAVINGQTGKIAADIPVDVKKYIVAVLIFSVPLFVINNFFLNMNFNMILVFSMFFNFIVALITNFQLEKLENRDSEDLGVNNNQKSDHQPKKKRNFFRPFLPLLFPVILFMLNPVNDIYYYITCLILLVIDMYFLINIIKKHNLLTKRNISQLEKRGGNKYE